MTSPLVSVLMPTYDHAAFLPRALDSLLVQDEQRWEAIVVDDGSPDDTGARVQPYLGDARVSYRRLQENSGFGAALNCALSYARAPLVAYLPSDDVYYSGHLISLLALLSHRPDAVLAYSGVRHHYDQSSPGQIAEFPLQLVQVVHRRGEDRWIEREELVTDDHERLFWSKLRVHGPFVGTGQITCEWVDHAHQQHKVIKRGINPYRSHYKVRRPLRFHSSESDLIDEVQLYRSFRERPDTPLAADGLKILLVGELAYNAERVLALEERGHKLYGLWMSGSYWFNTVGPLPFGHVEDLPRSDWQAAVRRVKPDVIYALLNWPAVPFAHHVLMNNPELPFVWHFKEGPFDCLREGTWSMLVDLLSRSDGQVYASPEALAWFATAVPGRIMHDRVLVLDGDLPKREWFTGHRRPRLSETDGQIHTVLSGRPMGIYPETIGQLARVGIHTHCYGLARGAAGERHWQSWIERARQLAGEHLHLHPSIHQGEWVAELSQYDAGWLHLFESGNQGDLRRASWDDLNYPARLSTLAAAGLPLVQRDNRGAIVASQTLTRRMDIGVFYSDTAQLAAQLRDGRRMARLRDNAWQHRMEFAFDSHADRLIDFFRYVIRSRGHRAFTSTSSLP